MNYAKPKAMKYGRTAIVCLANDLNPAATSRFVKRQLAGDEAETKLFLSGAPIDLAAFFSILRAGKSNRLIIIAHGDSNSTGLFAGQDAGAKKYSPQELAHLAWGWVGGYALGSVSLDACYSGGNKGNIANPKNFGAWKVRPRKSFAFEFASHFGIAGRVTARTDRGTTHYLVSHGQGNLAPGDMPSYNTVGDDRYHAAWDKIVIRPHPDAQPFARIDADDNIETKFYVSKLPPQPI